MKQSKSCVFLCSLNGIILNILKDDFGFEKIINKPFSSIIYEDHHQFALDMIVEVKKNVVASDYRLNLQYNNINVPVDFLAIKHDQEILLIGTSTDQETEQFSDQLLEISNEQTNQIRTLIKERLNKKSEETENELLFNELSSLNNELINLQRLLSKKNSELKRANEIKNKFIGMAAHDLRGPLINISSMSDFLEKRNSDMDKTGVKFIKNIKSQSNLLLKMVNELLDISAIESGSVKLNLDKENIISLVKQNIILNKNLAEKKEIDIRCESDQQSLTVKLDTNKIDQVLTNLITNAIKYSESGTEIIVAVTTSKKEIKVEVKDQGQGIPNNELDLLFKPFQKTSSKTTAGEKSTGLGLYIVKRIIEAHDGTVGATSKLNEGSVFFFTLPLDL